MERGGVRRVVLVLLVYLPVAWLILGVGGWLRRVLALPLLFDELLRGGLLVGLPVAGLLAWFYPRLAHESEMAGGQGRDGGSGEPGRG